MDEIGERKGMNRMDERERRVEKESFMYKLFLNLKVPEPHAVKHQKRKLLTPPGGKY